MANTRAGNVNHIGIDKMRFLVRKPVYWGRISSYIEKAFKNCAVRLKFQRTQFKVKIIPLPGMPKEVVGGNIFQINDNNFL